MSKLTRIIKTAVHSLLVFFDAIPILILNRAQKHNSKDKSRDDFWVALKNWNQKARSWKRKLFPKICTPPSVALLSMDSLFLFACFMLCCIAPSTQPYVWKNMYFVIFLFGQLLQQGGGREGNDSKGGGGASAHPLYQKLCCRDTHLEYSTRLTTALLIAVEPQPGKYATLNHDFL